MQVLNRDIVLNTLIKHETLTITDLGKEENIGFIPDIEHLHSILKELKSDGFIEILNDSSPLTYSITTKGIDEGKKDKAGGH